MWLTPPHSGTASACFTTKVWGSVNSSVFSASATTMAKAPSGVKYMLYGSLTGMFGPARLPVFGSIGVSEFPPSSFAAYRVFRSQAGMTCCVPGPLTKVSMTFFWTGSMTEMVPSP